VNKNWNLKNFAQKTIGTDPYPPLLKIKLGLYCQQLKKTLAQNQAEF